ncbi:MAG: antibiotic biosynthesis monooxygenase [Acidimicrobiaceae bacterium]|nr:antibiotic biosynthesis monooxygenase [Acidimicrobiaceae bacterium]
MVIVAGTFEVEPDRREEFLAGHHELMRNSRAELGCLEYTFSADPLDPGRVVLFERWASQEALDAHLVAPRPAPASSRDVVETKTASIIIYDVTGERPLRG